MKKKNLQHTRDASDLAASTEESDENNEDNLLHSIRLKKENKKKKKRKKQKPDRFQILICTFLKLCTRVNVEAMQ